MLTGLFAEIDAELGKERRNLTAMWLHCVFVSLWPSSYGTSLRRVHLVYFLLVTHPPLVLLV